MHRIKIATVSTTRVESAEERKDTQDRIEEERRHQTDVSCILLLFLPLSQATSRTGMHCPYHEESKAYDPYRSGERGNATTS
jgi:hypothetical protein